MDLAFETGKFKKFIRLFKSKPLRKRAPLSLISNQLVVSL